MKLVSKIAEKFEKAGAKMRVFEDLDPFSEMNDWLTTGSPTIDIKLNTFGIPSGIIEFRGESRSGKTTLAMQLIKNGIEYYGERFVPVIFSTERRDNRAYAQRMGIKIDSVLVDHIRNAEMLTNRIKQTIDRTEETAKEMDIKPRYLFVLDSLGALLSKQEVDKLDENAKKDNDDATSPAATARAFKRTLRYLTGEIYDKEITFIVINHTYDSIGGMGGKKSYGGNGIEYMPTMRFDVRKSFVGGTIKSGEKIVGQLSEMVPIKNDFNGQQEPIKFEIALGIGVVLSKEDIEWAIENKILEKHGIGGASFMKGKLKWKTRAELYDLYKDYSPLLKVLLKKLIKEAHKQVLDKRKAEEKNYKTKFLKQSNSDDDDEE